MTVRHLVLLSSFLWTCSAGSVQAVAPEVNDQGKLFSAEAIKKANAQIREIARHHGLDLLIETFETVPGNQANKVKGLPRKERTKFFQTWARERMEERVVKGVYILICKNPPFLRIEPSEGMGPKLGSKFATELGAALVKELTAKRFDDALMKAVAEVHKAFERINK